MIRAASLFLFWCFLFWMPGAPASESAESLFLQANDLFQKGISAPEPGRTERIKQAAQVYERVLAERGIRNGYLYYNLGNCYVHLGRMGKAIVNYRRAEKLVPNYSDLRNNLKSALARRKDNIQKAQMRSIARTLFFWHYLMSLHAKIVVFAILFSMIWIVLLVRLFLDRPFLRWGSVVCIFFAAVFGVSAALNVYADNSIRFGVIVVESTTPRKGPGESYSPTFKEALHEGTEFHVRDRQAQWLQVELDNGSVCWLKARDAELI